MLCVCVFLSKTAGLIKTCVFYTKNVVFKKHVLSTIMFCIEKNISSGQLKDDVQRRCQGMLEGYFRGCSGLLWGDVARFREET